MAPLPKIIDTHIHLWPSTATAPTDHGWMTQGHPLAKRHGVADYDNATSASPVRPSGFVYVETDRCLPSAVPEMQEDAQDDEEKERRLRAWAKAPLEELDFLKRIVGGEPRDGDGFSSEHDGRRLVGLVVWAPFHLPPELFSLYMRIVESVLQPSAWERVVGFRYLLQGKGVDEVRNVVESEHWLSNLVSIGQGRAGKGWSFDVGVDCHRDGVEGLEVVARMVERVRAVEQLQGRGNKVRFVLNHLCKPDLSTPWPLFPRYSSVLTRLAADPLVYMKLSGAFNEFSPAATPSLASDLLASLRPYLDHVLKVFGSERIMFGSDWPVCNVGGPKGEEGNWALWREVVERWLEEKGSGEEERERVWWRAGAEAYGLDGI